MKLSLNIFGYEIATVVLDLDDDNQEKPPVVSRGVKKLSKLWVKGMTA